MTSFGGDGAVYAAAQETTDVVRSHLEQIVAVRDVQAEPDHVSGVQVD